jgi:hypothetical protein
MEREFPRNKQLKKIMKEAEWLAEDIGGRSSYRMVEEIRERPTREEKDKMSRLEGDMAEIDGVHIDNDDIKNIAEDAQYMFEDVEDFLDPETDFQQKAIKLDAELRFSPKVQELLHMIMKDFEIESPEDLARAVETIGSRVAEDIESCPYYQRSRKATERMIRFAMKNVDISDLPKGKRMEWVNDLTRRLYDITKSETSVEDLHEFIGEVVGDFLEETEDYFRRVEAIEQKYNPNK